MGAKTAMLLYADGDVAEALHGAVDFDRPATEALVARLLPGLQVDGVADGNLDWNIHPGLDMLYAGVFPQITVICAGELGEIAPRDVRRGWVAEGAGRRVVFHSMHSVSDFVGFAVWREDGMLQRALCASPRRGVVEEFGDRLMWEAPTWPGGPLELGEAALAALCGFVREGAAPMGMPDVSRVPLAGFRLGRPSRTLERSHGPEIPQPSADEVEAQVRRLGTGLDYVVLDLGSENYLQVAAGGQYDIPVGVFQVEQREGGPDMHFRYEVETLDDVVGIFRAYLRNEDVRGNYPWEQIRL